MKIIAFAVLIAVVLATGAITSNRIYLRKGAKSRLNFACGAVDRKTGRHGVYRDALGSYAYSFKGHPAWLSVKGSYLVGTCPQNVVGEYPITVTYRSKDGKRTGSNVYTLSTKPAVRVPIVTGIATKTATYFHGFFDRNRRLTRGSLGDIVVLCPVLPATEIPATAPVVTDAAVATTTTTTTPATTDTPAVDTSASSTTTTTDSTTAVDTTATTTADDTTTSVDATTSVDPNLVDITAATQTATDAAATTAGQTPDGSTDTTVTTTDTTATTPVEATTTTTDTSTPVTVANPTPKAVSMTDTDHSCATSTINATTAGTGIVTAIASDSVTIDNKFLIKFGKCSRKSFYTGRKNFQLKDKVAYQVVKGTGNAHWAKSVICK